MLKNEIISTKAYHGEYMAGDQLWTPATLLFYLPDEMKKLVRKDDGESVLQH
jgi:hypothetical protein